MQTIHKRVSAGVEKADHAIENLPHLLSKRIRPYSTVCATIIECIHIDSPFTTLFVFLCFLIQAVNTLPGNITQHYFGIPPYSQFIVTRPLSWFTLFSHVLGHGSWAHLNGNVVNLLLVAPACERHFGAKSLLLIIFNVALTSGIAHMLFGPANAIQLGASGVVFAMILLNSLIEISSPGKTGIKGKIPLTFLCQVFLWVNNEIFSQFFSGSSGSGVSHIAHLVGAVVGCLAGYKLHPK